MPNFSLYRAVNEGLENYVTYVRSHSKRGIEIRYSNTYSMTLLYHTVFSFCVGKTQTSLGYIMGCHVPSEVKSLKYEITSNPQANFLCGLDVATLTNM